MIYGNKYIGTCAYMGGVPAVLEPFCWSWSQMQIYNSQYVVQPGEEVFYDRATISFHAAARNFLVDNMRGDWLCMFDCDHSFEPDILGRLLHRMYKYDLDIITALYLHKAPPHPPVIYKTHNDGKHFDVIGDWEKMEGNYLIPIKSCGAGCLLVKKSVFDAIKKEFKCGPFDIEIPFGEDHSMMSRANKLGFKAYCDPSIECKHLTVKELSLEDYEAQKEGLEFRKVLS